MRELFIGEAIQRRREALGLTQDQLCEGICTSATLSRLENGRQMPSYNRVKALLQKLGMPDERYYALLSSQEEAIKTARKEILSISSRFERAEGDGKKQMWKQAMEKLHNLEVLAEEDDLITRQFILSLKITLGEEDGPKPLEECLATLLEALRITAPNFSLEDIGNRRYTVDESRLINQIAGTYSAAGNHEQALEIYRQMFQYVHKYYDQLSNFAPHFTLTAYKYARELALCEYYKPAIKTAEEGKRVSVDYGYYQFLPGLLGIMAECYYLLGKKEKSQMLWIQSHYLYEILDDRNTLSMIDLDIEKRFGIVFPTYSESE